MSLSVLYACMYVCGHTFFYYFEGSFGHDSQRGSRKGDDGKWFSWLLEWADQVTQSFLYNTDW